MRKSDLQWLMVVADRTCNEIPHRSGLLRLVRTVDLTMPILAHDSLKLYPPGYLQMQHLAGISTNPTLAAFPTATRARTKPASRFEKPSAGDLSRAWRQYWAQSLVHQVSSVLTQKEYQGTVLASFLISCSLVKGLCRGILQSAQDDHPTSAGSCCPHRTSATSRHILLCLIMAA